TDRPGERYPQARARSLATSLDCRPTRGEPQTGGMAMEDFLAIALGFPAALLSFSLVIVVLYWVVVLLGGADLDLLDGDVDIAADPTVGAEDAAGSGGAAGMLAALGLGGVPVTVALSVLIPVAWFVSLVGTTLIAE